MRRGRLVAASAGNDLRSWAHHLPAWGCLVAAAAIVGLTLLGSGTHSLFRQALGGPEVVVLGGQLHVGAGWTWLAVGTLFIMSLTVLLEVPSRWTQLTLVRGVSRRQWVAARLAALAAGAVVYLSGLLVVMAVVAVADQPRSLVGGIGWDVGLWAVGLVGIGWFAVALRLITGEAWVAFAVPLLLLGVARFGGGAAPYLPFAQWIAALHGLPGTLSVAAGTGYVLLWTLLSGAAAFWAASGRMSEHAS